jgi:hypothetical protein
MRLGSRRQFHEYIKEKRPERIPYSPEKTYENNGWISYEVVHSSGLESKEEYFKYAKEKGLPKGVPRNPSETYKGKGWNGWGDWLGTYRIADQITGWSTRKVKELLKGLIESKIIYQWDEAVLYSFLLRKGLLNLQSRHTQFFKNLIEARRTAEGRKAIEEYVNSDSEIPPDLSTEEEEETGTASSQEIANLVENENTDPLDYGKIKTAQQILAQTNVLESINVDEEAMQFYVNYSINELCKSAFRDEKNAADVKNEGKNGNKYHDIVLETLRADYEGSQSIEIPKGYAFPWKPTLMQRYAAHKIKSNQYFGNFSGTGAGKTLSAVLSSRVIDSKMTLIVCPNDVVDQWGNNILEIFPDSIVITGKEAFYGKYDENKHQYLVLNYDKFSQDSPNLILNLVKQKVDFVVLDVLLH